MGYKAIFIPLVEAVIFLARRVSIHFREKKSNANWEFDNLSLPKQLPNILSTCYTFLPIDIGYPMKLSDYVVEFLADYGITHNFLVSGGAVVHLVDSTSKHSHIQHICVQHEQSGAAAADGYSRTSGRPGLAMTTSGPGATNLTTSICNAFFDSIPMICVTGQVAKFRLRPNKRLRQRGFQETDIESVFHSICKYVKLITDPLTIRYELEKALFLATEGRPGPVVLDIPDDLQRVEIDPEQLPSFNPVVQLTCPDSSQIQALLQMINEAKRPVLVVGAGIRIAKAEERFFQWVRHFKIPILFTWGGADLLPASDPLNMGGLGVCGSRAGNFAAQNSDLMIALGTRLSQMITGGKQNLFAPHARKVMIDIDVEELHKFGEDTFNLDLAIHSDLNLFFNAFEPSYQQECTDVCVPWRELIQKWRDRYPICTPADYQKKGLLNPYVFIKSLSQMAREGDIIVTDTGANICWTMQAFETKRDQKIFSAWNHTPMGYSLPASVGAALGSGKPVICLIGDGGLMMSLQELATVRRYNLPVKIFIFDNQGHTTMKQTLEVWLQANYVAVDEESGLSFPDYRELAAAFRLPYFHLKENNEVGEQLSNVWNTDGPLVCRLEIDPTQRIIPNLKFGSSLDQLDPQLSPQEINCVKEEVNNLQMIALSTEEEMTSVQ